MHKFHFLLFLCLLFSPGKAQDNRLQQKISLNVNDMPLSEVLEKITSQTGLYFVYSPDLIDLQKRINFNESNYPLKKALSRLLENKNIEYSFLGGQIILKAKEKTKKYTVSGTIVDSRSGEQLMFASVTVPAYAISTTSNSYGFFSFTIPEGKTNFYISYVSYKSYTRELDLNKDTSLNVTLVPDTMSMKEIIISDFSWKQSLYSINTGLTRINMQSLKEIPQILGESDVLKGIQSLPGVQSSQEGSNNLYIRGGNPDQNMYILDGVSIYNINHLFGYFSVFNAGAIQNTMFYKSGFPAKYGGRLSSILDMKLKEGNSNKYQAGVSIGTLTSSLSVEGPIGKKASFYVSGRRTYLDLIVKPLLYYVNMKSGDSMKVKIDANFYDVIAKVNVSLSDKSHLYFSNYIGGDYFGGNNKTNNYQDGGNLRWNNLTSALRWNYKFNSNLFINNTFSYSHFNFKIDQSYSSVDTFKRLVKLDSEFNSGISDFSFRSDWEYYAGEKHSFQFGAGTVRHNFNGGKVSSEEIIEEASSKYKITNYLPFTYESFIYAEKIWKITPKISTQTGVHVAFINFTSHFDYSIQPRLGIHYLLTQKWALKASYARMGQFLHLSTTGEPGLSFDIWMPVANYAKPQHSQQVAMGTVFVPQQKWEFSFEVFYKKFSDLLERKLYIDEYSGLLEWGRSWSVSNGEAKGTELMIQKKEGKLKGWISYTFSLSDRSFNTILGRMNSNLENSHKHLFNCNLQYTLSQKIHFSALWSFGSGAMITFPKQKYKSIVNGIPEVYYTEGVNNFRLAPYHRLDFGMNLIKKRKWYVRTWSFGIYNIYNQRNPNFIEIRNNKFIKYSYFSLVPSISFKMDFNTP